ncbi:MAG: condensation domain-containing protein, partial [Psychrosphaera sp.]|nr:condensation domain-containing protein [Psychrosphaera sp.]
NMHHIISDGWSQGLFYQELGEVYEALCRGQTPQLTALNYSYADYARWQSNWLNSIEAQGQLSFWQDYLKGCNEQLILPMQTTVTATEFPPGQGEALLELPLTLQLKSIAQQHRGSLFNVLHSAFALLLARLSGQHDLTIGLPVTGRHIYGTQDMLGMFLNNLPVRHQVDLQQPYSDYLSEQIDNIAGVLSNQDIPLERILELESVATTRSTDSTPLFQVLFNMLSLPDENADNKSEDAPSNVTISGAQTAQTNSKFDLTFYVQDAADGVAISCSYHSGKFTGQAINGLLTQYVSLLTQVAENIHQPCGQYSLNVGAQRIDHTSELPAYWPGSVVELFRQQVQQSPDAIAVEEPTQQWTYLDLLEV